MAQDFNQLTFVGRLVTDLDITPSTDAKEGYARGRMATNGRTEDKTLWLTVFFPESVCGRIIDYMTIGKPLVVSGRLASDRYKDKNGDEQVGLTVYATSVDFAPSGPRAETDSPNGTTTGRLSTAGAARSNKPRSGDGEGETLPF